MIYMITEGGTNQNNGGEQMQFAVDMTDPCFTATIDLSSSVVPISSASYIIGDAADVLQFDFSNIDDGVAIACPALTYTLTNQD